MKSLTEYLVEYLSSTTLFEMAFSRKDYILKVNNLSGRLVENWCLCKYCTLYNNANENHNHWQSELHAIIDDLNKMSVKVNKKKATEFALLSNDELNKVSQVKRYVKRKFDSENIVCNDNLANQFVLEIPMIIEMICTPDYNLMTNYCYSI